VDGLFAFALSFPLVETIGGNQTPPSLQSGFETGFLGQSFAPRVDHFGAETVVFGPTRHQSPAVAFERFDAVAVRVLCDNSNRLVGRDVIARREFKELFLNLKTLGDFFRRVMESETSAHNEFSFAVLAPSFGVFSI
jgi:hypothetical protein